jgi:hypothetical protein
MSRWAFNLGTDRFDGSSTEYPGARHRQLRLFRHLNVVRSRDQAPARQRRTKTKTRTVTTHTGKCAGLESGLEKKAVQRPTHISAREFIHWPAPRSHVDEDTLRSLFKLVVGFLRSAHSTFATRRFSLASIQAAEDRHKPHSSSSGELRRACSGKSRPGWLFLLFLDRARPTRSDPLPSVHVCRRFNLCPNSFFARA